LNPLLDFKTSNRALSVNGKRNNINLKDVLRLAELYTVKNPKGIIKDVEGAIGSLGKRMNDFGVAPKISRAIMGKVRRLL